MPVIDGFGGMLGEGADLGVAIVLAAGVGVVTFGACEAAGEGAMDGAALDAGLGVATVLGAGVDVTRGVSAGTGVVAIDGVGLGLGTAPGAGVGVCVRSESGGGVTGLSGVWGLSPDGAGGVLGGASVSVGRVGVSGVSVRPSPGGGSNPPDPPGGGPGSTGV